MEISGTYITKEERFSGLVAAYGQVIAKVCYLYAVSYTHLRAHET